MIRNNPKKQILLFFIGCAINVLLFILTKYTPMPLWLDYTGSLYVTVMCGPLYAFLSLALHTLLLTVLIDGWTAVLVALPWLIVCIIFYLYDKRRLTSHADGIAASFLAVISTFISYSAVFLILPILPHRYENLAEIANTVADGFGKFYASITLASVLTFTEVLLSILLFALVWFITPKAKDNMIFKK